MKSSSAIALLAALAGLGAAGCGSAVRPAIPIVSVFPIPGDQVASTQTQIAFRGAPIARVGNVVVTGSRSGRHTGRLAADSDGQGGSFLPSKPFVPGEVVTVRTRLHIHDATAGTFRFTVATPAGAIPASSLPPAGRVPGDELSFHSRPDLSPASVEITEEDPDGDGDVDDIFVTPQQGPTQNGPMILNSSGQLVWFQPAPSGDMAADLRVQRYHGEPVLTWWQGYSGAGVGAGEDVIENTSYRQVAAVHAANGMSADLHEFTLTPQGTALITAYYPVIWNAAAIHESTRQIVLDSVVQEIDVKTGLLLFQWDSLDHVPLTDTYEPLVKSAGQPFRLFPHQLDPAGEGRRSADLGPQHVGRVRGRRPQRSDRVDARRQELEFQARRRRVVRVPARRASPQQGRSNRDAVRRRRWPAAGARRVARDHGSA